MPVTLVTNFFKAGKSHGTLDAALRKRRTREDSRWDKRKITASSHDERG
jgi:hypothetical protein